MNEEGFAIDDGPQPSSPEDVQKARTDAFRRVEHALGLYQCGAADRALIERALSTFPLHVFIDYLFHQVEKEM